MGSGVPPECATVNMDGADRTAHPLTISIQLRLCQYCGVFHSQIFAAALLLNE